MSCCEENNHNCRQGRDCPLRQQLGDHAFRFYDLKQTLAKHTWVLVPPVLFVMVMFAMYYTAQLQKGRTVVYDCRIAEISPDFPPQVRDECRKLSIKK